MLAYVFWHVPAAGVVPEDYEAALAGFHGALREGPPLRGSATFALDAVPWLGDGRAPGYEDWYLVDDFTALGALDDVAVAGARREPHDAAAARSATGAAGVMAHVAGAPSLERVAWAAWLGKPAGLAYAAFHAALAGTLRDGAGAWQRQMTLGPAEEYCILAPAAIALPWPAARAWSVRAAVPAGGS